MAPSLRSIASLIVIPIAALITYHLNATNQFIVLNIHTFTSKLLQRTSISATVRDISADITYIGKPSDGVEQYLGIPYAEDTSGRNRFGPPKPLTYKPGAVITATKTGSWCPQATGDVVPFTSHVDNIGEDCLSLGITRPRGTRADARLPVLVFMHGGGHALGSYADLVYAPEGLVRQSVAGGTPVVFVGINYRLGIFGFASSKALSKAGHTNIGLRDQRAAFEWVQKNIAAFGGDPENVISVGHSVGASDTGLQMMAYGGEKGIPFQKAVMISGAPGLNFNIDTDQVVRNTASVTETVGCAIDGDTQSAESLECLQNVPLEKLANVSVTAMRTARPPFGEAYFFPTLDDDILPARPSELLRQGKFVKDIPLMASWCTNDGAWYAPPSTATDKEVTDSFTLWLSNLSQNTLEKLLELYPVSDFEQLATSSYISGVSPQYYRAAQISRDLWFTCPVLEFAYHHAKHANRQVPTYLYENNATRFLPIFKNTMNVPFWGVAHLSDIPYMLNNDVAGGGDNSPAAKALALDMSRSLVRFAYSGNPGDSWPQAFRSGASDLGDELSLMLWRHEENGHGGAVTVRRNDVKNRDEHERTEAVQWEKLFERCEFINSPQVRKEAGA